MSETPVIIEAAINGMTTVERNPHVPLRPDDIRADALRCLDAGAAIIHAHNHDISLSGAAAADAYLEAWAPLMAERPDTLWYPTLASAPTMEAKTGHWPIIAKEVPLRLGVVDPGSTNLGVARTPTVCRSGVLRQQLRRHPDGHGTVCHVGRWPGPGHL